MIIAVVAIAVLTLVATEFVYNSRVDLQMATNQRDEVRAYYLARSGIGLSRLLLRFQKQIDAIQIPDLRQLLAGQGGVGAILGLGKTPNPQGNAPPPPTGMNLQLWRMARVDCHMLRQMVRTPLPNETAVKRKGSAQFDSEFPEVGRQSARRSFGGFDGCFLATISDEEEKLNLNKLDAPQLSSQVVVGRLLDLLTDRRFEFLFEREDANRVKTTPQDVIVALRDWIDEDETQSALNLTGMGEPFVRGFSDENSLYDRYSPRYRAKNARFDTMDELYLVHGVNDRFMAAFRDRFTVYPDVNSRLNINTDDPMLLYMAILSVADPSRPDPRLKDPIFIDALIKRIRSARLLSILGMSVLDFTNVIESAGIPINVSIRNNVQNNRAVGDKSSTFSIKSVGEAGAVQKTISAVVRMDDQGLGRLVYWREE
jgi:general secretion pathway protein K